MPVIDPSPITMTEKAAVLELTTLTWEAIGTSLGPDVDPRGRLLATLILGGASFHVEAFEVRQDDKLGQVGVDDDVHIIFSEFANAAGGDGPFETVEIEGRDYAVFMSPFCR